MTFKPKALVCALVCALGLLLGSGTALADGTSRDQVIDAVQQRFHAKVVRVNETRVNGRPALELRLLSDQRVWNIVVDAATGQVLSGG